MIGISVLLMLVGLAALVVWPALGGLLIAVSALVFLAAGNRRRAAEAERRHQEMVDAARGR